MFFIIKATFYYFVCFPSALNNSALSFILEKVGKNDTTLLLKHPALYLKGVIKGVSIKIYHASTASRLHIVRAKYYARYSGINYRSRAHRTRLKGYV